MLAVMGCCRNLGGAVVLVDARIDVGSTTGGVGIAVGCASIPSVESGTTGFGTGVLASGVVQLFQLFHPCGVQLVCLVQEQRFLAG